jgi:hypothetical protein
VRETLYETGGQVSDFRMVEFSPGSPYYSFSEKPEGVGIYTMSDAGQVILFGETMDSVVLPSYSMEHRTDYLERVFLAAFESPWNRARARTHSEADDLAHSRLTFVSEVRTHATDPYLPRDLIVYVREPEHVGYFIYMVDGSPRIQRFAFAVFDRGGMLAVRVGPEADPPSFGPVRSRHERDVV